MADMEAIQLKHPVVTTFGEAFWNGEQIMDAVSFRLEWTFNNIMGAPLGTIGEQTIRMTDGSAKLFLTAWRTTIRVRDMIKSFLETGRTPNITFTGILTDDASDIVQQYGRDKITAVGCVPDGTLNLMQLDKESPAFLKDEFQFLVSKVLL